jgi:hypothetical protein
MAHGLPFGGYICFLSRKTKLLQKHFKNIKIKRAKGSYLLNFGKYLFMV